MARREDDDDTLKATRSWAVFIEPGQNMPQRLACFKHEANDQEVAKFAVAARHSDFHDEELAKLTQTLNNEIKKVKENNKDPKRELAFLKVPTGILLAWTEYGDISSDDDPEKIEEALGLK